MEGLERALVPVRWQGLAEIGASFDEKALQSIAALQAYVGAQLSPRSKENARDALRRIARLVGTEPEQIRWTAINYEKAMGVRAALYDQTLTGAITPGTANLTLSHLRGLVRTMHAMGLVTAEQLAVAHPAMLKNIPGRREGRGRALFPEEEKTLRTAAKDLPSYQGPMLEAAIVLAIGAGLRREEVARTTLEGLTPGWLSVIGKGNKQRRLVVDSQMNEAVQGWLKVRRELAPDHGGLFCSPARPEQTLSKWSFWNLVRGAGHEAFGDEECLEKCPCLKVLSGPHDFRRTFATRLLDQGFDIRQVQVLMGHESPETTARYDKRKEEELFEKRRKVQVVT